MGEIIEVEEINGEEIKTVEEVDGGLFEDETTGLSAAEGDYEDLGAVIETFDTSTPEAFKNATLGTNIEFNTVANTQNYRITYGSVLGGAKPVTELYGSVNDDAKKITKLYGEVEGEAKLIYQGFGHLSYD